MDLKLFLFKIILIFNVFSVYSVSCSELQSPGNHTIGKHTLVVKKVSSIREQDETGIIVYYNEANLIFNDGSKISISFCATHKSGKSLLDTHVYLYPIEKRFPMDITDL